jgi:membrane fusion protein (multidrug efflux system)
MNTATNSPAAPATLAPAVAAPATTRRLGRTVVIAVLAVALVAWLGRLVIHAYHYVETDNAYVVGHLHQISPQIDGQVLEVLAQDNQVVKQGDPLVRLDPLERQIALQKAEAGVAQAHAQEAQADAAAVEATAGLTEARAKVSQAEAQIVQAQSTLDLAQLTLTRSEQLFKNGGTIAQSDLDNARSAFAVASANRDAANGNRDAAQAATGSAESAINLAKAQAVAAAANVAVAEAAVRDAQRQLAYTTLTAPAAGRVGNKSVEVGDHVIAGQIVLGLAEPEVWIVANLKETQLPRVQPGQDVEIKVDALPGQVLHGKVDSLAPASGAQFALLPPDNATGNFNKVVQRIPVKIVLDEESRHILGDRLRLGYSVIVDIHVR